MPCSDEATEKFSETFGYSTIGPILAEFCMRLWLYEHFLARDEAVLLFCARGGLRLKLVYDRFLAKTGMPRRLPHATFMISRLVAARTALNSLSPGVLAELEREFSGQSMKEIAVALAQRDDLVLPQAWNQIFSRSAFVTLMTSTDPGVVELNAAIAGQNALFRRHLMASAGQARHCVIVDTGLYGSTLRMLQEGIPEKTWSALQFARCNYKRLAVSHFDRTVGISVESDWYSPWDITTSALRYWHLIEACLEPDLPSVRTFAETEEGVPRANLQVDGWEAQLDSSRSLIFSGALAYIESLSSSSVHRIPDEARHAWLALRNAVVWPSRGTTKVLSLGGRSRDFGRSEMAEPFESLRATNCIKQIRESLWREGAVVHSFPRSAPLLLVLIEIFYTVRALQREALRQIRKASRAASVSEPYFHSNGDAA